MVGFGIQDTCTAAATLVFCVGGLVAAVVYDVALCGAAPGGILTGLDRIICICFTTICG